jgi:hypothetical protein
MIAIVINHLRIDHLIIPPLVLRAVSAIHRPAHMPIHFSKEFIAIVPLIEYNQATNLGTPDTLEPNFFQSFYNHFFVAQFRQTGLAEPRDHNPNFFQALIKDLRSCMIVPAINHKSDCAA